MLLWLISDTHFFLMLWACLCVCMCVCMYLCMNVLALVKLFNYLYLWGNFVRWARNMFDYYPASDYYWYFPSPHRHNSNWCLSVCLTVSPSAFYPYHSRNLPTGPQKDSLTLRVLWWCWWRLNGGSGNCCCVNFQMARCWCLISSCD